MITPDALCRCPSDPTLQAAGVEDVTNPSPQPWDPSHQQPRACPTQSLGDFQALHFPTFQAQSQLGYVWNDSLPPKALVVAVVICCGKVQWRSDPHELQQYGPRQGGGDGNGSVSSRLGKLVETCHAKH